MLVTTIILAVLALAAVAGAVIALARVLGGARGANLPQLERGILVLCAAGAGVLFVVRQASNGWRPLEAHVDGLLLISALLAMAMLYLHARIRLRGASAFGLPLLALLLAWAVCASRWSFHPFTIRSVWDILHQVSVYLGTLAFAVAAMAGLMFLYVDRRLRHKDNPSQLGRVGNLEAIESLMIRAAAVGFAVLTLSLASGVVIVSADPHHFSRWWISPKVALGGLAWLSYGLVMNVRHSSRFRGARAAWLSIAGLALLLVTFALVMALPARITEF